FLKCSQVGRLLTETDIHLKLVTSGGSVRLRRFMHSHTSLLIDLAHLNLQYSSLFVAFLLSTLPINLYLTGSLLVGNQKQDLVHLFFIGTLLAAQFFGTFLIHLVCA